MKFNFFNKDYLLCHAIRRKRSKIIHFLLERKDINLDAINKLIIHYISKHIFLNGVFIYQLKY